MCLLAGRSTALCFPPHCRHFVQAPLAQRSFLGSALGKAGAARAVQPLRAVRLDVAAAETERLRLHNLSPQKGSRRDEKRKGRGYGGHQVGTPAAWQQCACQACRQLLPLHTSSSSGSGSSIDDPACLLHLLSTKLANQNHMHHAFSVVVLLVWRPAGRHLRFWKPRSEGPLRPLCEARL